MSRTLEYRRHQIARLKKSRVKYWSGINNPRTLGIVLNTPKPCACYMCANPRRFFGKQTIQEKKHGFEYEDFERELRRK